jgi:regulator of sigma E protease
MTDTLLNILDYALSFFVIISVIVFIHEFGHYIVAKWCGVKIEVFSIGFGKEVYGWTDKSGTRWKVSLLPLGGYVKMFGDASEASTPDNDALEGMSESDKQVSVHCKPLWQKALIVVAGPVANFLLTIVILTGFIFTSGIASTEPIVGEVIPGTPAEIAQLQKGDRFIQIDDTPITRFSDIPATIATNLGTPLTIIIERNGKSLTKTITPEAREDEDALGNKVTRPLIGFKSIEMTYEDVGMFPAVWYATKQTYDMCATTLEVLGQIITGERGTEGLKGPLGIAELSGQAADKGLYTVFWLMALLSLFPP